MFVCSQLLDRAAASTAANHVGSGLGTVPGAVSHSAAITTNVATASISPASCASSSSSCYSSLENNAFVAQGAAAAAMQVSRSQLAARPGSRTNSRGAFDGHGGNGGASRQGRRWSWSWWGTGDGPGPGPRWFSAMAAGLTAASFAPVLADAPEQVPYGRCTITAEKILGS